MTCWTLIWHVEHDVYYLSALNSEQEQRQDLFPPSFRTIDEKDLIFKADVKTSCEISSNGWLCADLVAMTALKSTNNQEVAVI